MKKIGLVLLFIGLMVTLHAQTKLIIGYDRVVISNIQMNGVELGVSGGEYIVNFSIAAKDTLMNAGQVGVLRNINDTDIFIGIGMSTYTLSKRALYLMDKDNSDIEVKFGIPLNIIYINKYFGVTGSYTVMTDIDLPNMFRVGLVVGINFK